MTHILPIAAYIEALENLELQSAELHHLHPVHDFQHQGFWLSSGGVLNFALTNGKCEKRLSTPLTEHFDRSEREIISLSADTLNHPFLAPADYIPRALTLIDGWGNTHTRPALIQEAYTPLRQFIRHNFAPSRRNRLRSAIESLWRCAMELTATGLVHGRLTSERICFDDNGAVRLADYPIVKSRATLTHAADLGALARAATLLFVAASEREALKLIIEASTHHDYDHIRTLRTVASAAEHYGVFALAELAKLLLGEASPSSIVAALGNLAAEPFRPMELLTNMLSQRARPEYLTFCRVEPAPAEEVAIIDFSLCDQVMPSSDTIVRYRRGNQWGYAHHTGEIIPVGRRLIAAYDFAEGRAVVRTERGYGLIDTTGRMVMNDVWSQMNWFVGENIVTAADEAGRWHIYDRMGHQLSAVACDWMGDAAEGYVVARRGEKYGYFAASGAKRTDFIYDEAYAFCEGVAMVVHAGHRYHIDTTFHSLSPRQERLLPKEQ